MGPGPGRAGPGCCRLPALQLASACGRAVQMSRRWARSSGLTRGYWQGQLSVPLGLRADGVSARSAWELGFGVSRGCRGTALGSSLSSGYQLPGRGGTLPWLWFSSQLLCRQCGGLLGPGNPPSCWALGETALNTARPAAPPSAPHTLATSRGSGPESAEARTPAQVLAHSLGLENWPRIQEAQGC